MTTEKIRSSLPKILRYSFGNLLIYSLVFINTASAEILSSPEDFCEEQIQKQQLLEINSKYSSKTECLQAETRCAQQVFPKLQFLRSADQEPRKLHDLSGVEINQLLVIQRCAKLSQIENTYFDYCNMQQCLSSYLPEARTMKNTETLLGILDDLYRKKKTEVKRLLRETDRKIEQTFREISKKYEEEVSAFRNTMRNELQNLRREQSFEMSQYRQSSLISRERIQNLRDQHKAAYDKLELEYYRELLELENRIGEKIELEKQRLRKQQTLLQNLEN